MGGREHMTHCCSDHDKYQPPRLWHLVGEREGEREREREKERERGVYISIVRASWT